MLSPLAERSLRLWGEETSLPSSFRGKLSQKDILSAKGSAMKEAVLSSW